MTQTSQPSRWARSTSMPTSRAIGDPQASTYSTPGAELVLTCGPTSYADSHLLGQLPDRRRRCAAGASQHVGKDFVGKWAAADLRRGQPVPFQQHLAGLVDVADLRVAARDVEVVVCPPLR